MNAMNQLTERIIENVAALSVQVALLVALVWAATLLLRRAAPRLRHGLWLIVVLRLCVPIGVATPVGAAGALQSWLNGKSEVPSVSLAPAASDSMTGISSAPFHGDLSAVPLRPPRPSLAFWLVAAWAAVAGAVCAAVLARAIWAGRRVRQTLAGG